MSAGSRSISLDPSALSPKEYEAYKVFMVEFDTFTHPRGGHLRFAEAAHFLRRWFPFETEREDEIRSFFPQKMQLGEMNKGCVLAILRLLSHIYNRNYAQDNQKRLNLYRDLIFLQTDPLPPLSEPQPKNTLNPQLPPKNLKPVLQLPNPFRSVELPKLNLSNLSPSASQPQSPRPESDPQQNSSASAFNHRHPRLHHPLSTTDVSSDPKSQKNSSQLQLPSSNPFRQRSASSNASVGLMTSNQSSSAPLTNNASPKVPPRPTQPYPPQRKADNHSAEELLANKTISEEALRSLPPPKHYSQRLSNKGIDESTSQADQDCIPANSSVANRSELQNPKSSSPSRKIRSPEKVVAKNSIVMSPEAITNGYGTLHDTLGSYPGGPKGLPPPPPAKPPRPVPAGIHPFSSQSKPKTSKPLNDLAPDQQQPVKSLTRAQTLSHPHHNNRPPPPLPPPRKRPESLQLHNPHSVPLDQLVSLGESLTLHEKTRATQRLGKRTVSNTITTEHSIEKVRPQPRRRSISLFDGNEESIKVGIKEENEKPEEMTSHLRQLRAIEDVILQDGKELVKEVKEGWVSRHGRRDERKPLVKKPSEGEFFVRRNRIGDQKKMKKNSASIRQVLGLHSSSISDGDNVGVDEKEEEDDDDDEEEDDDDDEGEEENGFDQKKSFDQLRWHRLE